MITTVHLDKELLATASRLAGVHECSELLRAALTALIEKESARRLARMGGTEPSAKRPRRRRIDAA